MHLARIKMHILSYTIFFINISQKRFREISLSSQLVFITTRIFYTYIWVTRLILDYKK